MTTPAQLAKLLFDDGPDVWVYKAEGAANVAMRYIGGRVEFRGRLLRLRKLRSPHVGSAPIDNRLASGMSSTLLPRDALDFAESVMRPRLGASHVIPGIRLPVPHSYLCAIAAAVAADPRRPQRRHADAVDVGAHYALLMVDHSMVTVADGVDAAVAGSVCYAVELKPKSGVPPGDKAPACRFCAHQILKALEAEGWSSTSLSGTSERELESLVERAASRISHYCPMDLYAAVTTRDGHSRVRRALRALMQSPQNNLRLFIDGAVAYTADDVEGTSSPERRFAEAILQRLPAQREQCDMQVPLMNADDTTARSVEGVAEVCRSAAISTIQLSSVAGTALSTVNIAPELMISILTGILVADSVLARLVSTQGAGAGVDDAWRTYQSIADDVVRRGQVNAVASVNAPDETTGASQLVTYASVAPEVEAVLVRCLAADTNGDDVNHAFTVDHGRTLGGCSTSAAARLRDFMISATAKDASVLVAFQVNLTSTVEARENGGGLPIRAATDSEVSIEMSGVSPPLAATVSTGTDASASILEPPLQSLMYRLLPHEPWAELDADGAPGASPKTSSLQQDRRDPILHRLSMLRLVVTYSVAIVDLDPKPLARVPHYADLERRIVSLCESNLGRRVAIAADKSCAARMH